MKLKHKFTCLFLFLITAALSIFLYPYAMNSAVLDPKGVIGLKEEDLMYIASLLMLIVVIPVLIMTLAFCVRYRASNKSAEYDPEWNHDTLAEAIWWGFPCLIILILSIVTWTSSHELDPYKPFTSSMKPVRIQVVALQWRWLFIYPDHEIASMNFFQIPENRPINFEITADAPMNSFWIPQLGGQIYAMPGMSTQLHLMADQSGDFRGSSANLSGTGFAGMHFIARASVPEEFEKWVQGVKQLGSPLGLEEYNQLISPSEDHSIQSFVLKDKGLYDEIVMKYMMPTKETTHE
jgi:cytochrome o ubiquinol oxidase subunit 2